jgi:hypothetical protein
MRGVRVTGPRSSCSKLRQYWTAAGPPPMSACWTWRTPLSGSASSSLSIGRMAANTGHHLWTFQGRFIRMPIRKTTKSPSILAE